MTIATARVDAPTADLDIDGDRRPIALTPNTLIKDEQLDTMAAILRRHPSLLGSFSVLGDPDLPAAERVVHRRRLKAYFDPAGAFDWRVDGGQAEQFIEDVMVAADRLQLCEGTPGGDRCTNYATDAGLCVGCAARANRVMAPLAVVR